MPPLVFVACIAGVAVLWREHGGAAHVTGQVTAWRADATAPTDGLLVPLPGRRRLQLLDPIAEGELVARLDERPVLAALRTMEATLARLRLEVTATEATIAIDEAERTHDATVETRRLAVEVEQARLEVIDRRAALEIDSVDLLLQDAELAAAQQLFDDGLTSELLLERARLRRRTAAERIRLGGATLREAEVLVTAAEARLAAFAGAAHADAEALLGPVRAAIDTQEAAMAELRPRVASLAIRAPIGGRIAAIHRVPGEMLRPGDPVVTIAARESASIVAYLRRDQRLRAEPGMRIELRSRVEPLQARVATVERVGVQYEEIPPALRREPGTLEWGLPVRVSLPTGSPLIPGELVDLRFVRGG